MSNWIKISGYLNSFEADIAKSVLESYAIECRIHNNYSAQLMYGLGEFELLVHESDAELALKYLNNDDTIDHAVQGLISE